MGSGKEQKDGQTAHGGGGEACQVGGHAGAQAPLPRIAAPPSENRSDGRASLNQMNYESGQHFVSTSLEPVMSMISHIPVWCNTTTMEFYSDDDESTEGPRHLEAHQYTCAIACLYLSLSGGQMQ